MIYQTICDVMCITINFLVVFGLLLPVYIINVFANIVYYFGLSNGFNQS